MFVSAKREARLGLGLSEIKMKHAEGVVAGQRCKDKKGYS